MIAYFELLPERIVRAPARAITWPLVAVILGTTQSRRAEAGDLDREAPAARDERGRRQDHEPRRAADGGRLDGRREAGDRRRHRALDRLAGVGSGERVGRARLARDRLAVAQPGVGEGRRAAGPAAGRAGQSRAQLGSAADARQRRRRRAGGDRDGDRRRSRDGAAGGVGRRHLAGELLAGVGRGERVGRARGARDRRAAAQPGDGQRRGAGPRAQLAGQRSADLGDARQRRLHPHLRCGERLVGDDRDAVAAATGERRQDVGRARRPEVGATGAATAAGRGRPVVAADAAATSAEVAAATATAVAACAAARGDAAAAAAARRRAAAGDGQDDAGAAAAAGAADEPAAAPGRAAGQRAGEAGQDGRAAVAAGTRPRTGAVGAGTTAAAGDEQRPSRRAEDRRRAAAGARAARREAAAVEAGGAGEGGALTADDDSQRLARRDGQAVACSSAPKPPALPPDAPARPRRRSA